MKTIICILIIIVIQLKDNNGSLSVNKGHSYAIGGTRYTVEGIFAENKMQLSQCFMNLLKTTDNILTETETGVTIKAEYVSAVGKDKDEKDS